MLLCDPCRGRGRFDGYSGGRSLPAQPPANRRDPSGMVEGGWSLSLWSVNAVGGSLGVAGVAGVSGLSEPATTEAARGAAAGKTDLSIYHLTAIQDTQWDGK